jgi:hypothetical protein
LSQARHSHRGTQEIDGPANNFLQPALHSDNGKADARGRLELGQKIDVGIRPVLVSRQRARLPSVTTGAATSSSTACSKKDHSNAGYSFDPGLLEMLIEAGVT